MSVEALESGIYRTDSLARAAIPGKTVEKFQTSLADILNEKKRIDSVTGKTIEGFPERRTFFRDVEEFFDTWMKGYKEGETQFGEDKYYNTMGFELNYVDWDKESDFYSIPTDSPNFPHEGIFNDSRLNPLIICADGNGLYDQEGYMNVGVNDFRNSTAIVYRGQDERSFTSVPYSEVSQPNFEKELRNDLHYYVWSGKERFPFTSSNVLKACKNIWHMVGISPLEVYQKLEDLNFKFPESS